MIKFRFSNISFGLIIFLSSIFLAGLYAIFNGNHASNEIKDPIRIRASIESVSEQEKVEGGYKRMIRYKLLILKTNEYPCQFNLGEIEKLSTTIPLSTDSKVHLYIKKGDKQNLKRKKEIDVFGLSVSGIPFISLKKQY